MQKNQMKNNLSIHQVINNFEEVEEYVRNLKKENQTDSQKKLTQELYDYLEDTNKDFNEQECNNILEFLINIDKDIMLDLLRDIHRSNKYILKGKSFTKNVIEHKKLADVINRVNEEK